MDTPIMMTMKKRSRVAVAVSTAALTTASLFAFAASPAGAAAEPPWPPKSAEATGGVNRINAKWEPADGGEAATAYVIAAWALPVVDANADGIPDNILTEVVLAPGKSGSILEVPAGEYAVWVFAQNAYPSSDFWSTGIEADGSPVTVTDVPGVTPGDPDTRPYRPFDNWEGVIRQEYQDWLGRAPRLDELTFWRHFITSGSCFGSSPLAVGDEHYTFACRLDFVSWLAEEVEQTAGPAYRLYSAYFSRNPEFGGLKYWHNSLRTNRSLLQVSDFFVGSKEFEETYGGYATHAPEGPATDAAEFVALIYANVLNRTPDGSGFAFWTRQLQTERMSPGEVMIGFSESQEFKNRMAPRVATGLAYTFMLERTPTEDEYVLAEFFNRGFSTSADPWGYGHWGNGELYLYIIDSAEYIGRV